MPVVPFIADSAAEALAQIREQLGEDAVVVNVRKLPADGLSRFWKKPRIEVVAWGPDPEEPVSNDMVELRHEIAQIREQLLSIREPAPAGETTELLAGISRPEMTETPVESTFPAPPTFAPPAEKAWRASAILQNIGILAPYAESVVQQLYKQHGETPPDTLAEELLFTRGVLAQMWVKPASATPSSPMVHVFIGAPGVGKTTCLCKWLTQLVLLGNRPARVWRLDGRTANTAESLSVYCEILGVPMERSLPEKEKSEPAADEAIFIDLPGVAWTDAQAVEEIAQRLQGLPAAQVHLVLNAAYETPLLLAQTRAFGTLPVTDLILTHLDEENRWGKLWNLVLGTNYTIRYLAGGQNIPGDFIEATAERLLSHQFPRK